MSVRTATLAATGASVAGQNTLATVPAGETWILKSAHGTNGAATPSDVIFYVRRPSVPASIYLFQKTLAVSEIFRFDGWVVLQPADEIKLYVSVATVFVWVSGSRLIGLA